MSGPREAGQTFQSCPAQTGEVGCTDFPDGAHRCTFERVKHNDHGCTCGAYWIAVMWLPKQRDIAA